ncbi:unnamed protein product [Schistosoma haematobium]|nr:unnamed protein product [Schistosoma haematobium]
MPNNRRRKLSPRLVDVKRDEQKDGSPQSRTVIVPNYFVLVSIGRGCVSNSSRQLSFTPNRSLDLTVLNKYFGRIRLAFVSLIPIIVSGNIWLFACDAKQSSKEIKSKARGC